MRKNKRFYYEEVANKAENAARTNDAKTLYDMLNKLKGEKYPQQIKLNRKNGKIYTAQEYIGTRWTKYF